MFNTNSKELQNLQKIASKILYSRGLVKEASSIDHVNRFLIDLKMSENLDKTAGSFLKTLQPTWDKFYKSYQENPQLYNMLGSGLLGMGVGGLAGNSRTAVLGGLAGLGAGWGAGDIWGNKKKPNNLLSGFNDKAAKYFKSIDEQKQLSLPKPK